MDFYKSKYIAENISNEQIREMFYNAKNNINDWTELSSVNRTVTKGTAWNVLAKDFNPIEHYSVMLKTKMIMEFGEFLPKNVLRETTENIKHVTVSKIFHEDPVFNNYE